MLVWDNSVKQKDLQNNIRKYNIKIIKKKIKNVRKYIDKTGKWSYNKFNKREEITLKKPEEGTPMK